MIDQMRFFGGDGAGAVIVEASDEPGIIKNIINSNGEHEELLHVPESQRESTEYN